MRRITKIAVQALLIIAAAFYGLAALFVALDRGEARSAAPIAAGYDSVSAR